MINALAASCLSLDGKAMFEGSKCIEKDQSNATLASSFMYYVYIAQWKMFQILKDSELKRMECYKRLFDFFSFMLRTELPVLPAQFLT